VKKNLTLLFLLAFGPVFSQSGYYYPPLTGSSWDTVSPQSLGWCIDKLDSVIEFSGQKNSKALIILYKGRIALEKYYGSFTGDSIWYWASAGKSLTSLITGIAQDQNLLSISDSTSKYLGAGWTNCTPTQEAQIKIVHQLTMTTGLDYHYPDLDCVADSCLNYHAPAGTEWYYYNAPYHLIQDVIANASGVTYNAYTVSHLSTRTGIYGYWFDYIFYSKPLAAARLGLLMLNNAVWNTDTILRDRQYLDNSRNTSQNYNQSYGYLWWLNGKSSFMSPGSTIVFPGMLCPPAPPDMYAALGKNDQKIYIVPSMDLVVVRMGDAAGQVLLGPSSFDSDFWEKLMQVFCNSSDVSAYGAINSEIQIQPNPANACVRVRVNEALIGKEISIYGMDGGKIMGLRISDSEFTIQTGYLASGIYFLKAGPLTRKFVVD